MKMVKKGDKFEILTVKFANELFEKMGFQVIKVRKQWSGTQYGFDVLVIFLDDNQLQREICMECKDYSKDVEWSRFSDKILQINASPYDPTAFIALSPHSNISNVDDALLKALEKTMKFPIQLWCPDSKIEEIFAVVPDVYKEIYGVEADFDIDIKSKLKQIKNRINFLINKKNVMNCVKKIEICETDKNPVEDKVYRTNLDEKLNLVLGEDDPDRLSYHQFRCDYKVYLQNLEDLDNELRTNIINWQNNLRIKAKRLTNKFNDTGQSSREFFHEFFDEAEKSMAVFLSNNKIQLDDTERLLHGVVFELAAECPLNWVPRK